MVDLSRSDYDWQLLLRNMPDMMRQSAKSSLATRVLEFRFRPLDHEDPNYAYGTSGKPRFAVHAKDTGDQHVFEMVCADGYVCHMHFHQQGSCDVVHVPYDMWCSVLYDTTPCAVQPGSERLGKNDIAQKAI